MVKELFIPDRGWIPRDKLIEELEKKAAEGKLSDAEKEKLRELKERREPPVLSDKNNKAGGMPPLAEDWRPGNYL